MAWERSFEKRVLDVREKELKAQKLNYTIEVWLNHIFSEGNFLSPLTVRFSSTQSGELLFP
jgi:hypothetical protein